LFAIKVLCPLRLRYNLLMRFTPAPFFLSLTLLLTSPLLRAAPIPETTASVKAANPRLLVEDLKVAYGESLSGARFAPDGAILTWGVDWGDPNKPDAKRVGWLHLREAATGKIIRAFEGHGDAVRQAFFSRDGRRLASQGQDGMIALWDVASGRLLHTLAMVMPCVHNAASQPQRSSHRSSGRYYWGSVPIRRWSRCSDGVW
jgi:WD40 repeat protein